MKICDAVRTVIDSDGGIVMNIETGLMISLNTVGTNIWSKIRQGFSEQEIIGALVAEFGVRREEVQRDVGEFIEDLQRHRLVNTEQ